MVTDSAVPRIAGLILAAGLSSRMGAQNKLTTHYLGKPLLLHCIGAAAQSGLSRLLVVTGHEADAVRDLLPPGVEHVHNPDYASGMASSLVRGIKTLRGDVSLDGVMILLGDMPLVSADHIRALLERFAPTGPSSIVMAANRAKPGNPVLFSKVYYPVLQTLSGDRGAKPVIEAHRDCVVMVDIGQAAERDFDTPDAFN